MFVDCVCNGGKLQVNIAEGIETCPFIMYTDTLGVCPHFCLTMC